MNRPVSLPATVRTPSRRALMKGAAWATPVAAVSIAAPALATSHEEPPISVTLDGDSCKYPGQSTEKAFSYKLIFTITNNRDYAVEFRVTSLFVDPNSGANIQFSAYPMPGDWITLAAGASTSLTFISDESTNSANGTAEIDFEVRKVGGGAEPPVSGSIPINGLPPCDKEDGTAAATAETAEEAVTEEAPAEETATAEPAEETSPAEEPTEAAEEEAEQEPAPAQEESEQEPAPADEETAPAQEETAASEAPSEEPTEEKTLPVSDEGGAADSWIQEESTEKG